MKNIRLMLSLLLFAAIPQNVMSQPTPNIAELTRRADAGDKQAQEDLGGIYIRGTGLAVNYELARKYYLLAAEQDMTRSQHNLCNLYGSGNGVAKNIDTAISWCEKSANKGFLKSQILLGDIYLDKGMTIANVSAARNWYLKAAAQNDAYSQYMAAQTYFHVPAEMRNYEIGLSWAQKSAAQNFPEGIKLKSELEAVIAENNANKAALLASGGKPTATPAPANNSNRALANVTPVKASENPIFEGAPTILVRPLPARPLKQ